MRKMKKIIWAMKVAAPAMPPKPKTAAMMAMTKNTAAQYHLASPT
jgi:hypothetical protein